MWSDWSVFSKCTVSCGLGRKKRPGLSRGFPCCEFSAMSERVEALGVCKWFTPRHSWKLRSRPKHALDFKLGSTAPRRGTSRWPGSPTNKNPGLVSVRVFTGAAGWPCAEA